MCLSTHREPINSMFQIFKIIISIALLLSLEKNKCRSANHIFKIDSHFRQDITPCFKGKNELQ